MAASSIGGAQFLSSHYATLMPLIKELGMQSQLVGATDWVGLLREGKIRKISANHFFTPVMSGYLNPIAALKFMFNLRRWGSKVNALSLSDYSEWEAFDYITAADFIAEEFGEDILEYLIEPQMQGFHYQSPEQASSIHALMLLSFMFKKSKVVSLRNGMDSLPEALANHVEVKLNCCIHSVETLTTNQVKIKSDDGVFYADKVILAVPSEIGKKIFVNPNQIESVMLQENYNSTINVGIVTDDQWSLPKTLRNIYGILLPHCERQRIAAVGIESNKLADRVQQGELLNVMFDSMSAANLLSLSDDAIVKLTIDELEKYFPGIRQAMRLSHVMRWQYAEPISTMGKSKKINDYKSSLNSSSNVILIGDYMSFPYTDGAAFTGKWAAEYLHSIY